MPTITKSSHLKYRSLEKRLLSEKRELSKRIRSRLTDVFIETEPDDEAAHASGSTTLDMTVATMERERETLSDVEAALKRIEKGQYGLCESCEAPISDARLQALPWARLCISCANGIAPSTADYLRLRKAS